MTDQADTHKTETALERAERVRAERKAGLQKQADEQRAKDLEAINTLEEEYGDTNILMMNVPFTPGHTTCIAARTPNDPEMKRYRYRLKTKKAGDQPDVVAAHEELADVVRVYPLRDPEGDELYSNMRAARSGIHVQLGAASVKLATAREEQEGKA